MATVSHRCQPSLTHSSSSRSRGYRGAQCRLLGTAGPNTTLPLTRPLTRAPRLVVGRWAVGGGAFTRRKTGSAKSACMPALLACVHRVPGGGERVLRSHLGHLGRRTGRRAGAAPIKFEQNSIVTICRALNTGGCFASGSHSNASEGTLHVPGVVLRVIQLATPPGYAGWRRALP